MAIRQIVHLPEPILRKKAKPVTKFDKDLQVLIDDMIETMREAPGVGLAAPQINL
ncbi:MAG TPA: peptide deformylase, partial [Anaerolineales bacterium]|nr:peptide deformylase [Anaerolineales bacterium]